jgi:WD repeat-containing protein 89
MSGYGLVKTVIPTLRPHVRVHGSNMDPAEYIFDIGYSSSGSEAAVSISDNSIKTLSDTLEFKQTLLGHKGRIQSVQYLSSSEHILASADMCGGVKCWDTRTGTEEMSLDLRGAEIASMSVGFNDSLLAVGVENKVCFYDIRNTRTKIGEYSDIHTDDVTQVLFSKTNPNILASGSEDGLVCLYNVATAGEDSAVVSILNTESPIRRFGFFGPGDEGIYALSTIEGASFWHYPSALRVSNMPTLRDAIGSDYLVDCFPTPGGGGTDLTLLAGMYNGNAALCPVEPQSVVARDTLVGGHTGIIRCAQVPPAGCTTGFGNVILTGGEEGRVCIWRYGADKTVSQTPSLSMSTMKSTSGGGRLKTAQKNGRGRDSRENPF